MGEVIGAAVIAHVPTIVLPERDRRELNEGKESTLYTGLHRVRSEVIDRLKPDLIVDYGEVTLRYFELAQATQQKTGIPTLLFAGSLDNIPRVVRQLG